MTSGLIELIGAKVSLTSTNHIVLNVGGYITFFQLSAEEATVYRSIEAARLAAELDHKHRGEQLAANREAYRKSLVRLEMEQREQEAE